MTPNPDEAKRERLAEAIKRGICARINATKKLGSPSVTPDQLSGAFYDQEIKHHVNAIESELAAASRRETDTAMMSVQDFGKLVGRAERAEKLAEDRRESLRWALTYVPVPQHPDGLAAEQYKLAQERGK